MSSNEIRIHKTLARCGILAVVLLATLCRCARQAAPQGGPRDSLPPKVVTMTPAFGTTHFKDKRILIEFDEYVQLEDQSIIERNTGAAGRLLDEVRTAALSLLDSLNP